MGQHRKAGRSVQVASMLPADQLAAICKQAADECQGKTLSSLGVAYGKSEVRLEQASPGRLAFSVRNGAQQLLNFVVLLTEDDGRRVMTSRIGEFKTSQLKYLWFIPAEPKKMIGLPRYEQFIGRFGELVSEADPEAIVTVSG